MLLTTLMLVCDINQVKTWRVSGSDKGYSPAPVWV